MSDEQPKRDVVLVGPPSDDGEGRRVLRCKDETIEVGELRTPKEGKPIHGELVRLTQRKEHDRLFDVEVILPKAEAQGQSHAGPARVANEAYRLGWDAIFGPAKPEGAPN